MRPEIDSPGQLPNGATIEDMEVDQAACNEVFVSVFGRIPVGRIAVSGHRRYLMERRGDGLTVICRATREATGAPPECAMVYYTSLVFRTPSAKLYLVPSDATVGVHSGGEPVAGIEDLSLFPNKMWVRSASDEAGNGSLELYTTHLPRSD